MEISNHIPRKGTETSYAPPYPRRREQPFQTTFPVRGRKLVIDDHRLEWPRRFQTTFPVRGRKLQDVRHDDIIADGDISNHIPRKGTETDSRCRPV